jgi:hypothetical protein
MRLSGILWCWLGVGLGLLPSCSDRDMNLDDESETPGDENEMPPQLLWDCSVYPGCLSEVSVSCGNPYGACFTSVVGGAVVGTEVVNLTAGACAISDGDCLHPVEGLVESVPWGGSEAPFRVVQVALPSGFEGLLHLAAPGYMTTDYYFGGPVQGNVWRGVQNPIFIQREDIWYASFQDLRLSAEAEMGAIVVRVSDGLGGITAGVRLSLSGSGVPWVMRNGFMTRADEGELATDATGIAGFVNVTPGVVRIEGSVQTSCDPGSDCTGEPWEVVSSLATRVRPDRITLIELRRDYSYGR